MTLDQAVATIFNPFTLWPTVGAIGAGYHAVTSSAGRTAAAFQRSLGTLSMMAGGALCGYSSSSVRYLGDHSISTCMQLGLGCALLLMGKRVLQLATHAAPSRGHHPAPHVLYGAYRTRQV